ncbi:MAG TPA: Wzz/FepE/Etk N-terminal domain-containing protein [Thermoleophilaceae bacterium]|nr:Wzz/FepE/Etk N-terminal domain-containing protein [Thermoleophilaceae bacterium]
MSSLPPSNITSSSTGEDRIDGRRYLGALRRSRTLILFVVLIITGAVVAASLVLPKQYQASTSIVLNVQPGIGDSDPTTIQRQLVTLQTLIISPDVLDEATKNVPGQPDLGGKIDAKVNPDANIIDVTATDGDPALAAQMANTVASTFLKTRTDLERSQTARARERLQAEVARLQNTEGTEAQVNALQQRISQLSVNEESAGSDLQQVGRAEEPDAPSSPQPLRNGLLAFVGSLFLGVLLALGRDQLSPRLGDPRELGRALDLRVLAGVPYVRGLRRRRAAVMSGVEAEAYETVRAGVELVAGRDPAPRLLLVTGAVHGEGKTTAVWRLGNALARTGHKALILSADLRVPRMHEVAGIPLGLGLSDILAMIDWEGDRPDPEILDRSIVSVVSGGPGKRRNGRLDMITSGTKAKDPGRLVTAGAMGAFLGYVRTLDYDYVLVDAPPLLGIVDAQVLARYVDHVLLVNRLDRLSLDNVADLRQTLDRMEVAPLGIVVIGAKTEVSPYYTTRRPPVGQPG